jgi:hypothetical protein
VDVDREAGDRQQPLVLRDGAVPGGHDEEDGRPDQKRQVDSHEFALDPEGPGRDGGQAEHETDVRHVRPHRRPEHDLRRVGEDGEHCGHEFRQGGPAGDDRGADQEG